MFLILLGAICLSLVFLPYFVFLFVINMYVYKINIFKNYNTADNNIRTNLPCNSSYCFIAQMLLLFYSSNALKKSIISNYKSSLRSELDTATYLQFIVSFVFLYLHG